MKDALLPASPRTVGAGQKSRKMDKAVQYEHHFKRHWAGSSSFHFAPCTNWLAQCLGHKSASDAYRVWILPGCAVEGRIYTATVYCPEAKSILVVTARQENFWAHDLLRWKWSAINLLNGAGMHCFPCRYLWERVSLEAFPKRSVKRIWRKYRIRFKHYPNKLSSKNKNQTWQPNTIWYRLYKNWLMKLQQRILCAAFFLPPLNPLIRKCLDSEIPE